MAVKKTKEEEKVEELKVIDMSDESLTEDYPENTVDEYSMSHWKYYCEACANYAFFSREKDIFITKLCNNCGKTVHYNPANYLPL